MLTCTGGAGGLVRSIPAVIYVVAQEIRRDAEFAQFAREVFAGVFWNKGKKKLWLMCFFFKTGTLAE